MKGLLAHVHEKCHCWDTETLYIETNSVAQCLPASAVGSAPSLPSSSSHAELITYTYSSICLMASGRYKGKPEMLVPIE